MQKTIVVIDDDRTIQATLSAVLPRHGYDVRVGPNASQGKKRVAEVKPDLVLLDLGLPDADGLDVLRELKAEHPDLPVIVLTANDSLANAIESIKQGAFHFLSKPYAIEELLSLRSSSSSRASRRAKQTCCSLAKAAWARRSSQPPCIARARAPRGRW